MKTFAVALVFLAAMSAFGLRVCAQPAGPSLDELWATYKQRFIDDDGRLVDDSAQNVSHSEGQGYGMLLAAFAGDRETFTKLWTWTSANLQIRSDGLAAWRWRPQDKPHVLDKNNATDGDLLIAWALAEAGQRWQEPSFDAAAAKIAHAIAAHLVYRTIFGPALSPGAQGFGSKDSVDGPVVNLSYWVFPAFDALERVAPDVDWVGLHRSGMALIDAAKFGPSRLPSDWIALKGGVRPAAAFPRLFGYDVVRAPLYLAWIAPKGAARLGAMVDAWTGADDTPPSVIDLDSGAPKETFSEPGYLAVAALARCAAHAAPFPPELMAVDFKRYYPATLHMLALTALRETHLKC